MRAALAAEGNLRLEHILLLSPNIYVRLVPTFFASFRFVMSRIVLRRGGASSSLIKSLSGGLKRRVTEALKGGFVRQAGAILGRLANLVEWGEQAGYSEVFRNMGLGLLDLKLQEAEILWAEGDFMGAIRLGKLIVEKETQESEGKSKLLATAMLRCGKWMALSKTDSAKVVHNEYLKPSVNLSRNVFVENDESGAAESHLVLAEFQADLLDSVDGRLNSLEWRRAGKKFEDRKEELENVVALYETRMQDYRTLVKAGKKKEAEKEVKEKEVRSTHLYMKTLKKEIEIDEKEREAVTDSRIEYLKGTLQNYVHGLSLTSGGSSSTVDSSGAGARHIFRFVSVWLKNSDRDGVNKITSNAATKVPR